VLDTIGGDNIDHSLEVTKEGGSIISIPTGLNGAGDIKSRIQRRKRLFHSSTVQNEDMKQIASLLKAVLKPHVSKIFPFEQMREAHLEQETGRTVGKIVVTL
jgi:NADPH:quinone reductase-like Zn-dependent oxidoreductase